MGQSNSDSRSSPPIQRSRKYAASNETNSPAIGWIVVTGPPGSGKSTLRRRLSKMLNATSVDIAAYYPKSASFSQEEGEVAFSKLTSRLLKSDQTGPRVVEAMFYQQDRRREIEQLAHKMDTHVVFVFLDADLTCLFERVGRRRSRFDKNISRNRIQALKGRFSGYDADLAFRTDLMAVDDIAAAVEKYANSHAGAGRRGIRSQQEHFK